MSKLYTTVYEVIFESLEVDEKGVPVSVINTILKHKPNFNQIKVFEKNAQKCGYKLLTVQKQKRYHIDEF